MVPKVNFHIGHLNVFHLFNKVADVNSFIQKERLDILGISESRLHSNISDDSIGIPGYDIIRRDGVESSHTGLVIYVNHKLNDSVHRRPDLESSHIECIWLEVKCSANSSLLLCILYRNPASTLCWFDYFVSMLDNANATGRNVLLLGDFNIDMLKRNSAWDSTTALFGLSQLVNTPTRVTASTSTLIDHIYTTNIHLVQHVWVPNVGISDHFPVLCSLKSKLIKRKKLEHTYLTYRSFKHFHPEAFCHDLQQASFHEVLNHTDPNNALQLWYHLFLAILNKHAPVKKKRVRHPLLPPWLTKEVIKAMSIRDNLRKNKDLAAFKKQRNVVKSLVRKAKKDYFQTLIEGNNNISTIWKAINTFIKPNKASSHSTLPSVNANDFNKYFLSVADKPTSTNSNIFHSKNRYLEEFCQERLTSVEAFRIPLLGVHEVGRFIESLNKKSTGPDGISSSILKLSLPYIIDSLTHIYNQCISEGTFPQEWKKAKVIPLPKIKTPTQLDNYRPISILSVLSKPLEKHVHKHLMTYLDKHSLLYPLQSGFRPNFSCHTALTHLIDNWLSAINTSEVVGSVFLDFKKAFDMVHHDKLLDKLSLYLRNNTSLKFFQSFLHDRQQRVQLGGTVSTYGTLKSGVPQGSVLGPLLFCLFINDLPMHLSNKTVMCTMFADDTTLSVSGTSTNIVTNTLQKSLDELNCWCLSNYMVLNPLKTKYMVITTRQKHQLHPLSLSLSLGTMPVERVTEHKVLGVIIDEHIDWNAHLQKLCHKVSSSLFLLSKLRQYVDTQACRIFFHAHILSHINYGSTLWDNCSNVNLKRLNSLYRRASKIIITDKCLSTEEKMELLDIPPLKKQFKINKCVLMKKIVDGRAPNYLLSLFQQSFRSCNHFLLPQPRIDLFKSSLSYSGVSKRPCLTGVFRQLKVSETSF